MNAEEYKLRFGELDDAAPGWDAIDQALKKIYEDKEPQHFGPGLKYMLGGPDPIDGISVYQSSDENGSHLHIVTYGFSSLYYDEQAVGGEFSKFGFELTMRLRPESDDDSPPMWAINMLQNIARYVFKSGNWLESGHYMPANGKIKLDSATKLVGLAFEEDPQLGMIETVHGKVQFLQVFGLTELELEKISNTNGDTSAVIEKHRAGNKLLVTVLSRDGLWTPT